MPARSSAWSPRCSRCGRASSSRSSAASVSRGCERFARAWRTSAARASCERILAMGAVLGLFGFSAMRTLVVVLADETLHGGARTFGALFAAYGAGAVAGALAGAARVRTSRRMLVGGALLFSTPILALAPV